jgi:hypothetical protein
MSEKEPPQVLNFDNPDVKRRLMRRIGSLTGLYEVSIRRRKKTRSLNANSYYHVAVCAPFCEWLREQWGDPTITHTQAHELLKKQVLGVKELEKDGEILELIPTSHDMDQVEFGQFIEKCAAFLAEFCSIVVIPPELFFEGK